MMNAYIAHVQPHFTKYGSSGVDLFLPGGSAAIWCKNRLEARKIAQSHGCDLYSERAATVEKCEKTAIYGFSCHSEAEFYKTFKCKKAA